MKKRLRCIGLSAALLGIALGILYEASTHVARGWLRGEAFYDGRPTSYWRPRCDQWLERFDAGDEFSFEVRTWMIPFEFAEDPGPRIYMPPEMNRPERNSVQRLPAITIWTRIRDSFRSESDLEHDRQFEFAPKILLGTLDTRPVLEELAAEGKYRPLATIGLKRLEKIQFYYAEFKKRASKD
jgi:hypothetical protein